MLNKRKTFTLLTLMLIVYFFYPISIITYHAPKIGSHSSLMDLSIQAYKTYLMHHFGLSHSDWDPYSYLGRPPLIIYPIVPFIATSSVNYIIHDYELSCLLVEMIFRALPFITAMILCMLDLLTSEAFVIVVLYILLYGLVIFYINLKFVRLTTPMGMFTAVSGLILAYSKLSKRKKIIILFPMMYLSEMCNFIYPLPALLMLSLIVSPILILSIIPFAPVVLFTVKTSKLMFYNTPAASSVIECLYSVSSILLFISILLLIPTIIITLYLLVDTNGRSNKIKFITMLIIEILFLIVNIAALNYDLCNFILKHIKLISQLDTLRLMLPSVIMLMISLAELVKRMNVSMDKLLPLSVTAIVIALITGLIVTVGKTPMDVSICSNYYNKKVGPNRMSSVFLPDFNNIFPSTKFSCKLCKQITGAFYQGTYESEIRILSVIYLAYRPMFKVDFSTLTIRGQVFPWASKELIYKLCKLLPVDYYSVSQSLFARYIQLADIFNIKYKNKDPVIRCGHIYKIPSKALYLGRPTDYAYLWVDIVNSTNNRMPNVIMVDIRDSQYGQNIPVKKALEIVKPKIILIDPCIIKYGWLIGEIKRYTKKNKVEIIAVKSVPEFDHVDYSKYYKICKELKARIIKVYPVVKINEKIANELSLPVKYIKDVGRIKMGKYLDEFTVNSNVNGLVLIPMSFAPYWSINGHENKALVCGPYMIIDVHKGLNHMKYVGWEKHQSKAYKESIVSFLLLYLVAVIVAVLVL